MIMGYHTHVVKDTATGEIRSPTATTASSDLPVPRMKGHNLCIIHAAIALSMWE